MKGRLSVAETEAALYERRILGEGTQWSPHVHIASRS